LAFLRRHHIALWDVLATCQRIGSADARIVEAAPNDVASLLAAYPNIRQVLLNGQKAAECFRRLVQSSLANADIRVIVLPSTSPANT